MSETREFSTAALASISTGTLLCNFEKMHEAAEYLMGHPIWTHHFGSEQLWQKMSEAVRAQHPQFPTEIEGVTSENYREKLAELETRIGRSAKIVKGSGATAMHPLEGIPAGKPVIVIKT